MNTIKVFIVLVSMVWAFFMPPRVLAETAPSERPFPYTLSVGVLTGLLIGQSEEIVYKPNSDEKLSQLLWDMKPLFYIGADLNFSQRNPLEKWGFFADLSLKFGIPSQTGIMEDRDWNSDDNHLTNFSSHDNDTEEAFLLDTSLGFSIPIASKVLFKVYGAFSYMCFSWASKDGYIQYESNNWNKIPISGSAINYSQEWFILAPGIGVWVPFLKFFSAGIDFQISSPIKCAAQDEHVSRNDNFNDYVFGGLFLEPKGTFIFSPLPRLDIALSVGWRYISGPRGASYMNGLKTDDAGAGTGYSVLDTGISVKLRF